MLAKATVPAAHLHTLAAPLLCIKSTNCHSHPTNAQTLVGFFLPHTFSRFFQKIRDMKMDTQKPVKPDQTQQS